MTYWIQLAIAAAIAGAAFAGGWQTRSWKAGADDAQRLELAAHDARRRSDQAISAAAGYEAEKAAQRPKIIVRTREVARELQTDPDCAQRPLPAGLRDALTRAAAGDDQPLADGPMPAAPAARAFDLVRPRDGLLRGLGGALGLPSPASSPR